MHKIVVRHTYTKLCAGTHTHTCGQAHIHISVGWHIHAHVGRHIVSLLACGCGGSSMLCNLLGIIPVQHKTLLPPGKEP